MEVVEGLEPLMQETCLRQSMLLLSGVQWKLTEDVERVAQLSFPTLTDMGVPILMSWSSGA